MLLSRSALESGVVHVQSPSHLRHKTPPLKYPLRAAAWACYDPGHGRRRTSTEHDDTFLHVPLGDLTKSITESVEFVKVISERVLLNL